MIFGVGGGVSFYEGLLHILHRQTLEAALWSYIALGIAATAEGTSLTVAVRAVRRRYPNQSIWKIFRSSKDPTVLTILFEDTAALVGIGLALIGVVLSHAFDAPWIDGVAAMCIGVLLMSVAILLARESKSLVVGEAADPALVGRIRSALESEPDVDAVGRLLTMHFGPDAILLNAEVRFRATMSASELANATARAEARVREICPSVRPIFIENRPAAHDPPD